MAGASSVGASPMHPYHGLRKSQELADIAATLKKEEKALASIKALAEQWRAKGVDNFLFDLGDINPDDISDSILDIPGVHNWEMESPGLIRIRLTHLQSCVHCQVAAPLPDLPEATAEEPMAEDVIPEVPTTPPPPSDHKQLPAPPAGWEQADG